MLIIAGPVSHSQVHTGPGQPGSQGGGKETILPYVIGIILTPSHLLTLYYIILLYTHSPVIFNSDKKRVVTILNC